jgi:hypothetical protein
MAEWSLIAQGTGPCGRYELLSRVPRQVALAKAFQPSNFGDRLLRDTAREGWDRTFEVNEDRETDLWTTAIVVKEH